MTVERVIFTRRIWRVTARGGAASGKGERDSVDLLSFVINDTARGNLLVSFALPINNRIFFDPERRYGTKMDESSVGSI